MTEPAIWHAPQFLRSQAESALWNALLSYREQPLAVEGSPASFRFFVADAPGSTKPALLVKTDSGPSFVAVIENLPFDQLFGVELDPSDLMALPAPLRNCLEEGIISLIWQLVPQAASLGRAELAASGTMAEITAITEDPDGYQWLLLAIDGVAPVSITLLIGFSPAAFVHLVSRGALAQSNITGHLAASLATEAYFTIGSILLSYQELSKLEYGDLVVLPHVPADQWRIRAGDIIFTFSGADGQLLCIDKALAERYKGAPSISEETRIMDELSEQTQEIAQSLEDLNVVIDFDIGRKTVSLAELQSWHPGTAVDIEPPALNDSVNVTVRANGQIIGTGDLVRIDDRIAVRLTRLTFRSEPGASD